MDNEHSSTQWKERREGGEKSVCKCANKEDIAGGCQITRSFKFYSDGDPGNQPNPWATQ